VSHPWDTGDLERNWQGYFIPGTSTLRNRVGALTLDALRDAENDLVEARVIELREAPDVLGDRSYDLAYLRAIHGQLFQDVYVWAGDVRTVGIEKGDESFCPPGSISQAMDHVAAEIHHLEQLKAVPESGLARAVAYLYDYANFAHPSVRAMAAQLASSLTAVAGKCGDLSNRAAESLEMPRITSV
jgi:cell filamentation protein